MKVQELKPNEEPPNPAIVNEIVEEELTVEKETEPEVSNADTELLLVADEESEGIQEKVKTASIPSTFSSKKQLNQTMTMPMPGNIENK